MNVLIVGAGAFGLAGAVELRRRGHGVDVLDPGPVPHPDASSTDLSKAVRMDYGADDWTSSLAERTFERWAEWNRDFGEELYHEDGFLLLTRGEMAPGSFERASFDALARRGHAPQRITPSALTARFPAWRDAGFTDGYFNPRAGWAESGKVVAHLAARARGAGAAIHEGQSFASLVEERGRVTGVVTQDGSEHRADVVIIAAGAWTPKLLPHLARIMQPVAQPVVHFHVDDDRFRPPAFPVWAADISRTGWYGFPGLADGRLKIGNHGPGVVVDPDAPRALSEAQRETFRAFVRESFPALGEPELVGERICLYCDTTDGDFWVDRDPERDGLIVAAGGSGHGFKFAPLVGDWIAELVDGVRETGLDRVRWREPRLAWEAARFAGDGES